MRQREGKGNCRFTGDKLLELFTGRDDDFRLKDSLSLDVTRRVCEHQCLPKCVIEHAAHRVQLVGEGLRGNVPAPLGKPALAVPRGGVPNGDALEAGQEILIYVSRRFTLLSFRAWRSISNQRRATSSKLTLVSSVSRDSRLAVEVQRNAGRPASGQLS